MGLGQLTAIFGGLGNTPPKTLQSRTSHASTSPPLSTTWKGYIWQIDGTSSLSNSVRGKEQQILVMGCWGISSQNCYRISDNWKTPL